MNLPPPVEGLLGSDGPRICPDLRPDDEVGGCARESRVRPFRSNLGQGTHYEQAFVGPGMRQNKAGRIQHLAAVGDKVEIEGAGRVLRCAFAAHLRFQLQQ